MTLLTHAPMLEGNLLDTSHGYPVRVPEPDAVYRPGDPDEAAALLPFVRAAAAALELDLNDFDELAAAGHLAGLLRQRAIVEAAGAGRHPQLAPTFVP
jgi:hypothetical protein